MVVGSFRLFTVEFRQIANPVDNQQDEIDNDAMKVRLPVALEEFVQREVAAGQFKSADEMVCKALRLLHEQHEWKADARLRIEEGWREAKAGGASHSRESPSIA